MRSWVVSRLWLVLLRFCRAAMAPELVLIDITICRSPHSKTIVKAFCSQTKSAQALGSNRHATGEIFWKTSRR